MLESLAQGFPADTRRALRELLTLYGGEEVLAEARRREARRRPVRWRQAPGSAQKVPGVMSPHFGSGSWCSRPTTPSRSTSPRSRRWHTEMPGWPPPTMKHLRRTGTACLQLRSSRTRLNSSGFGCWIRQQPVARLGGVGMSRPPSDPHSPHQRQHCARIRPLAGDPLGRGC